MKIYNHDILTCTHEQVEGNYLYSGRVLGSTEPEDIIQLHPDLQQEWSAITAHYDQMGLSHSQQPIWNTDLQKLTEYSEQDVSVFYFGDTMSSSSRQAELFRQIDPQWSAVVEKINSKNYFIQLAHELGVPVPQTVCLARKADLKQKEPNLPYPCYLKPAVSVDGMGIARCSDELELLHSLENLGEDCPFQIQEELTASTFLNLQYRATPHGCERIAASEQILSECSHSGNRYPTTHQPWEMLDPMADWLTKQGIKDVFAFDVAVCDSDDQPCYFPIECNPRFNGASYPTGIAKKLNIPCWTAETMYTQHRSIQDIDLGDLTFDNDRGMGVILVNWGTILIGKLVVLLAGSIEQQNELRSLLKQRL